MQKFANKSLPRLFYLLFFIVPLILHPQTSELFELNKIVIVYLITILIVSTWIIKMLCEKRIIFIRSLLDYPLLIFLITQTLSTLISIDTRTSFFGYYSRFHGGLLSTISYCLLYWAYVSNMEKKYVFKTILSFIISAILVSIYAVLQHFGIDKDVWVQDVQNRVFSTLGQPNWLAAWIVALTPLTWSLALNSEFKIQNSKLNHLIQNRWIWLTLSSLFFLVLLYTKSRSGTLGFVVADLTYWGLVTIKGLTNTLDKSVFKKLLAFHLAFLVIALATGTPWTPSLSKLIQKSKSTNQASEVAITGPALETGGTESTKIRSIVWKGAVDIWKNYPILGSGVETFAFSYYQFRPVEHNLVSEWDFLYNKAHNEYLNFLATTGLIGMLAYLTLIGSILWLIIKKSELSNSKPQKDLNSPLSTLHPSLLAGFASILVTNFFGFSVVPVAIQFFLYPAMATSLSKEPGTKISPSKQCVSNISQKAGITLTLLVTCYLSLAICKYWYADYQYSKGKIATDSSNYTDALNYLNRATKLIPNEAIYWNELAQANSYIALSLFENGENDRSLEFAGQAILQSNKSLSFSPANVNLKRYQASMLIKLSALNSDLLLLARKTLDEAVKQAPTDAKLFYNLALSYLRTGNTQKAVEILKKTIDLKPNYREAYYALGLIYIDLDEKELAKEQFNYILENINPNDKAVQRELDELK